MKLSADQRAEVEKYGPVYSENADYRMGDARFLSACDDLRSIKDKWSYLDVGCGRGEMLKFARKIGFVECVGVEVVDDLCIGGVYKGAAWDLPFPDGVFQVVSLWDVIEHLLPADAVPTIKELQRVASETVFITAANYSSKSLGVELHVNRRPYPEWDALFREHFDGNVTWLPRRHGINSETWRVDFA